MATTQVWQYYYSDPLGPGAYRWLSYGPADALGNSALSVTAIPLDGIGEGGVYVLKVEDINITDIESDAASGFPIHERYVGFLVRNNGGGTTVTQWSISIGIITP
jgi:hypothetical protein